MRTRWPRCCGRSTRCRSRRSRACTGPRTAAGVGLVAACDIAIGAHEASFALSEAKLGLIPATIGPYVIEAIGARQARRYFLTAERFDAARAQAIGLLHEVVPAQALDARIGEILKLLLAAGPAAQLECKALIRGVAHRPIDADVIAGTARHIAAVRVVRRRPGGDRGVSRQAPACVGSQVGQRVIRA